MAVTLAAGAHVDAEPRRAARAPAPRAPARTRRARAVGAFEQDDAGCASSRCGGTRRGSVCCAISLIVPAISTPVGPPPMTTKVSQASRARPGRCRARRARRRRSRGARMSNASASVFRPGRVRRPVVVAEVAVGRAGGDDQVVVGDALAVVEDDAARRRRRSPCTSACRIVRLPRFISRRSTWRIGALIAGALRPGGRHLVEQRLEQVVVGAVDERDLDRRPATARAPPRGRRSRSRRSGRAAGSSPCASGAAATRRPRVDQPLARPCWMWVRSAYSSSA